MTGAIGRVKNGAIQLSEQVAWADGQSVLVIALPDRPTTGEVPPDDLLAEDAKEFAPRHNSISEINRDQLA
jgi:hypothetical protein